MEVLVLVVIVLWLAYRVFRSISITRWFWNTGYKRRRRRDR